MGTAGMADGVTGVESSFTTVDVNSGAPSSDRSGGAEQAKLNLRRRLASMSCDKCPGCQTESDEGDGCDTPIIWCSAALAKGCNVKTYCAMCNKAFRLRRAGGWSGGMCSCKSILTADQNFAARWAVDWHVAVVKLAAEIMDADLISKK